MLADKARDRVEIGAARRALLVENNRGPGVGGLQHRFRFGDYAEQGDRKDLLDVLDRQHFALFNALQRIAGQQQMHLDRLQIVFGAARFGSQDADDPVAVAHRGNLGVGDDDRAVGEIESGDRTVLDPGRAVADNIVEAVLQLIEHPFDPVALQGLLVPRLRRRENIKVVVALILDQRLVEFGVAVYDIDEVEHNAALAAHDQIEVAQPHVEIDNDGALAAQSQPGGDRSCGGGLADAPLARCEHDYFGQTDLPLFPSKPIVKCNPRI